MISQNVVMVLIEIAATIGEVVAKQISDVLHDGNVSAVVELSKTLPDAHQLALYDEACRIQQRKLAAEGAV